MNGLDRDWLSPDADHRALLANSILEKIADIERSTPYQTNRHGRARPSYGQPTRQSEHLPALLMVVCFTGPAVEWAANGW